MPEKNVTTQHNFFDAASINFENLVNLPCYVFWKNTEGIYLGYNDYGAANLGYGSGKEIAGQNDYELFPKEMATFYRENDHQVITEKKQLFVPERGVLKNSFPVVFLSYKMPLYHEHEVIGVLGISFTRPMTDTQHSVKQALSQFDLAQLCNAYPPQAGTTFLSLSAREKICLQYLCEGLTFKMIAKRMGVSPKTIETYITRAKVKMNCHNKAQLILAFTKRYGS